MNNKDRFGFRYTKIVLSFSILLLSSGCEPFVDVNLPQNQLVGDAVFEDKATATAALFDVYARLRETGILAGTALGVSSILANYADEMDYYGTNEGDAFEIDQHLVGATNRTLAGLWNNSYSQIYAINAIIEGLNNSSSIPDAVKGQLKGEALFLRAILHFYLVNLYGDIPYITTTNYIENSTVSRQPKELVYQEIINDLLLAKELLPENYIDDRTRPNKWVAAAFLSRVYLYDEQWTKAEEEVTAILNSGMYNWETDLQQVFLKESTSALWQFKPRITGGNTLEARTFILNMAPPALYALSNELLNSFEEGDLRKEFWIGKIGNEVDKWYFPFKYKRGAPTGISEEYSIIIRLAELYLIRAEARARQGKFNGALEDLNKVRNRAGLEAINLKTQDELLQAILQERSVELFTEFGHRWFDLKRFGRAAKVLAPLKSGWEITDVLLPIPEMEIIANPNLKQNPGY